MAALPLGFVLFHFDAVSLRVGIFANSSHLPGNFHSSPAARDPEAVVFNFIGHVHRRETADAG